VFACQFEDSIRHLGRLGERRRVLLGKQGIIRKPLRQTEADHHLSGEIGKGHRRPVALGERVAGRDDRVLNPASQTAHLGDNLDGSLPFRFVHGRRV